MDSEKPTQQLLPGARVRVTQQIAARHYSLPTVIEGTIVSFSQQETGSWFAHSRDDRLWLDRLAIRLPDGELTTLILDDYSHVELLAPAPAGAGVTSDKKDESDLPV